MRDIDRFLQQWEMDARDLHRRMILAPTARERERWHALWLLAQGLDRLGQRTGLGAGPSYHRPVAGGPRQGWTYGLDIRADRGVSPALGEAQQGELKGAVQQPPAMVGTELANWCWKGVRQFVSERFGIRLSRSCCLNYLHRSVGLCAEAAQETPLEG